MINVYKNLFKITWGQDAIWVAWAYAITLQCILKELYAGVDWIELA
jgi:hypothetical protein